MSADEHSEPDLAAGDDASVDLDAAAAASASDADGGGEHEHAELALSDSSGEDGDADFGLGGEDADGADEDLSDDMDDASAAAHEAAEAAADAADAADGASSEQYSDGGGGGGGAARAAGESGGEESAAAAAEAEEAAAMARGNSRLQAAMRREEARAEAAMAAAARRRAAGAAPVSSSALLADARAMAASDGSEAAAIEAHLAVLRREASGASAAAAAASDSAAALFESDMQRAAAAVAESARAAMGLAAPSARFGADAAAVPSDPFMFGMDFGGGGGGGSSADDPSSVSGMRSRQYARRSQPMSSRGGGARRQRSRSPPHSFAFMDSSEPGTLMFGASGSGSSASIDAQAHLMRLQQRAAQDVLLRDEDVPSSDADDSAAELADVGFGSSRAMHRFGMRSRETARKRAAEEGDGAADADVRVKTEPVDEDAQMSDAAPRPASPTAANAAAADAAADAAAEAAGRDASLLLTPDAFLTSMQTQLLANVPKTILYVFDIVEQKLAQLRQQAQAQSGSAARTAPQERTSSGSNSNGGAAAAAAAATSCAAASASPAPAKASPGVLAEQRALVAKLKQIQNVTELTLFTSGSGGADAAAAVSPTAAAAASAASASAASLKVSDIAIVDEASAYRAVLVQALVTILTICQRARSLEQSMTAARASKSPAAAFAASGTFPRWFPSHRACWWQLLVCESLLFLESTPSLASVAAELAKHLKKILVFLCGSSDTAASLLRDTFVYEQEFAAMLQLFGVEHDAAGGERLMHVDEATAQLRSSSFTSFTPASALALASRVFAQRQLAYPQRLKLLQSLRRIEAMAQKRTHTFLDFMLNKAKPLPAQPLQQAQPAAATAAGGAAKEKASENAFVLDRYSPVSPSYSPASLPESSEPTSMSRYASYSPTSPSYSASPAVSGSGSGSGTSQLFTPSAAAVAAAASAAAASAAAPTATATAATSPPRVKLVYLLYLLSLTVSAEDEELPAIMCLLGVISQFVPQLEPAYRSSVRAKILERSVQQAAARVAAATATSAPASSPLSLSSLQRHLSTPPLALAPPPPPPPSLEAGPMFRSMSGGTVMSLLNPQAEEKETEAKQREESDARVAQAKKSALPTPQQFEDEELPTPLTPLASWIVQHRPELLFGFVQRHLLENGSISVRTQAQSFVFLLWRSLPSQRERRHLFNNVLSLFIDGSPNRPSAAALQRLAEQPSLTSIALYGAHAREYLTLVHTLICDSKHAHQQRPHQHVAAAAATAITAATAPKPAQGDSVAMELDDASAGNSAAAAAASPAAGAPHPSTAAPSNRGWFDDDGCVAGLTAADCSAALRRLLDCMSAQAAAFHSHALGSAYAKLQSCFDLAPSQHFLQNSLCSSCNGRSSKLPVDSSIGGTGSAASKQRASAYPSSLLAHPRYGDYSSSSAADVGYQTNNLKDICSEAKYTHCSRALRLTSLQTIHLLQMKISGVPAVPSAAPSGASGPGSNASGTATSAPASGPGSSRHRSSLTADGASLAGTAFKHVKRIDVYYSTRVGVELAALPLPTYVAKAASSSSGGGSAPAPSTEGNEHWSLARSVEVPDTSAREVRITFPIGLPASALLIHFSEFFEQYDSLGEPIICPRCHVAVASRTSQCSRCRETVGQCARCRAIDYEHTDAFQCSECSHSRYGTFNFVVQSKASSYIPPVRDEAQRKQLMGRIATLQERIQALLRDDMERARKRIEATARSGLSRLKADDTTTARKKKSAPRETRLDLRVLPASRTSLSTPAHAALLRSAYESDVYTAHSKLSELYRELQANRAELFLYLHHGNAFHMQMPIAPMQDAEATEDTTPAAPRAAPPVAVTNCYSCAKHFLLLSLATLHELDAECLLSAHRLDAQRSSSDLNLLLYYLSHSVSDGPNPFALEAAFLQQAATKLLTLLLHTSNAEQLRHAHTCFEERIMHAMRVHQPVAEHTARQAPRDSSDDASAELLTALLAPILELSRYDLALLVRRPVAASIPSRVAAVCSRLQLLFRVLRACVLAGGARSASLCDSVLVPILSLLSQASSMPEPTLSKKSAAAHTGGGKTAEKNGGDVAAAAAAVAAGGASASAQVAARMAAMSRQLNAESSAAASALSEANDSLRRSLERLQQQQRQLQGERAELIFSDSALTGLLPSLAQPSGAGTARRSALSAGAAEFRMPASIAPASVASGAAPSASGAQPPAAPRRVLQRSPGIGPSGSPGSSRLGKAGRVQLTPGSASQQAVAANAAAAALPPLSLASESAAAAARLTVHALAEALLGECASLWPGEVSAIDFAQWTRAEPMQLPSAMALLDALIEAKSGSADASAAPAASAAAAPPAEGSAAWRAAVSSVLNDVMQLPCAASFVLSQHDGITNLSSVDSRLSAGEYATRAAFLADIEQIKDGEVIFCGSKLAEAEQLLQETRTRLDKALAQAPQAEAAALDKPQSSVSPQVLTSAAQRQLLQSPFAPKRTGAARSKDAADPCFVLRSLLLCPLALSVRQHAAQLLWCLAFPAQRSQNVNLMTYKPRRRVKKRNSSGAGKMSPAAPLELRATAFIDALLGLVRGLSSNEALYSRQLFGVFTALLHASSSSGESALKLRVAARGVLPLLIARFHSELSALESEERALDCASSVAHLSSVVASSSAAHADVHRHHVLEGIAALLACLLDDERVLASFKRSGEETVIAIAASAADAEPTCQQPHAQQAAQVMAFALRMRGLMLVHSRALERSSVYLAHAVNRLFSNTGSDQDKKTTLQAYVYALSGGRTNTQPADALGSHSTGDSAAPAAAAGASSSLSPHITLYILQQLCDLIKAPQLTQQCLLMFKKSPTQEEFIRGNMKRTPYLSSSFAPASAGAQASSGPAPLVLMRHVKEAICTHLKLPNEENMLECLVAGKIVGMDVPVLKMYTRWYAEQSESSKQAQAASAIVVGGSGASTFAKTAGGVLLVPAAPGMLASRAGSGDASDADSGAEDDAMADVGGSSGDLLLSGDASGKSSVLLAGELPMPITYRLTGLDGEATEEKIDSIPEDVQRDIDPEVEFALAGALGEAGLRALLQRLDQTMPDVHALSEDVELRLVSLLLKLLSYASKLRANRALLLQLSTPSERSPRGAVPFCFRVLLDKLVVSLQAMQAASAAAPLKAAAASTGSNVVAAAAGPVSPLATLSAELLALLTVLLHEYASHGGQSALGAVDSLDGHPEWLLPSQQLHALLGCLALPSVRSSSDLTHRLLAVLPLLSFGQRPLLAAVEAHFSRGIDLQAYDVYRNAQSEGVMEAFAILCEEIPRDAVAAPAAGSNAASTKVALSPVGAAIRDYFFASDLVQRIFTYLQQAASKEQSADASAVAAAVASADAHMSAGVVAAPAAKSKKRVRVDGDDAELALGQLVGRASLPLVLRMLTGLSYGHSASQALASKLGVLRILHGLEGMASSSRVGPLAESLLQSLTLHNEAVTAAVAELRGHKKLQKKQKALDQRAKMLSKMGFASDGGKVAGSGNGGLAAAGGSAASGAVAAGAAPSFAGLESLEDTEHVIKCVVCMEGYAYHYKTASPVGIYVLNTELPLSQLSNGNGGAGGDDGSSSCGGGDESLGVSTVTHFTLIHFRCHQEAARNDKRLKPPKTEWEGASIRNQHTLCNNLFPILQPPNSVLTGELARSTMERATAQALTAASMSGAPAPAASPPPPSGNAQALMDPTSPLWDAPDVDASLELYQTAVEQYWAHIPFHGSFSHSRIELLVEDLRSLLLRFAHQESFSELAKGGGPQSNLQFTPYLVQMSIFLLQYSTQATARERLEGHVHTAMQVLGGIDTATTTRADSDGSVRSASGGSAGARVTFNSLPFLNPELQLSGSSFPRSSSGSPAGWLGQAPSVDGAGASAVFSPSAPLASSLRVVLSRSSLHDLVPASSDAPGSSSRLKQSLYSDPCDYLQYLMVLTLLYCTPAQWNACKHALLWRLLTQAKDLLRLDLEAEQQQQGQHNHQQPAESKEAESKQGDEPMHDADAPAAAAAAAATALPQPKLPTVLDAEGAATVARAQLEVLRPLLLFWSLVDSLHGVFAPPAGSTYTAAHSDAFLASSSSSAWLRRWRRSFTRAGQLATFRSLLRREHAIHAQLAAGTLRDYERLTQIKDVRKLIEAVGAKQAIEKEGMSVDDLLSAITDINIAQA